MATRLTKSLEKDQFGVKNILNGDYSNVSSLKDIEHSFTGWLASAGAYSPERLQELMNNVTTPSLTTISEIQT